MKELKSIFEDSIFEFIRYGEYDPSEYALTLCWREAIRARGASEVVSEAIDGDEKLCQDIADWAFHRGKSGDQGFRRVNHALCTYVKKAYIDDDEPLLWEIYENSIDARPDPMTLAKYQAGY